MRTCWVSLLFLLLAACDVGRHGDTPVDAAALAPTTDAAPAANDSLRRDEGVLTTLNRGNGQEPQTLDPHLASGVPASNILRDLFEGLTGESPDGRIIPGAAQRWNISHDGTVYTFHLRRDARWSNGDPVTGADFVFGLQRSADPETASSYVHVLAPIQNAEAVISGEMPVTELGVHALDTYTVQITLNAPTPYFLGLLTHSSTYPVHQASLQAAGRDFSKPGNLVSNGAYRLQDWVVRSQVSLLKNPYYWDADNVAIDKVVYHAIEDQSAELKRYRSGELDWTEEVPNNLFRWIQEHMADQLVVTPWLGSYYFGFNLTKEPFIDSPDLRRALALAIDREIITGKVTQFGEQPAFSLVPPGMPDYPRSVPEWAEWDQARREEEARRLYQNAGYSSEAPLRVEIRYNTSENHKKIALAIASMWKQVLGVEAGLVNEEWKVFLQNREQKSVTQVFRAGWIGDYNDAFSFLELFHSSHGRNDFGYSNPVYDRLLADIAKERIPIRRRRLMAAAEQILLQDQPIIPIYAYVTKRLVKPQLKGWENNIMDHHYSKHLYFETQTDEPADSSETLDEAGGDAAGR